MGGDEDEREYPLRWVARGTPERSSTMRSFRWFLAAVVLGALVACGGDGAGEADAGVAPDAAASLDAAAIREPGSPRSLLGYLYADCPWQAFPSLPELGAGCSLDVFLAAAPAGDAVQEVCAGGARRAARPSRAAAWSTRWA